MVSNLTQRIEQALNARAAQAQQAATATAQALAVAQFNRVWQMLVDDPRLDVQDAVAAVQVEFDGRFVELMAEAFSALLQRSVGAAQVRAMRVGDITLSQHLYRHRRRVQAEVTALVREHAKGVQQAQALAMRLYDGYNPADGIRRPLEGAARARLPKALRTLTADPAARASLQRVVESGQAQAARLKTRGLRAAYEEAFEAWRAGAGQDALRRKLEVALREKNRMYAERIARTELARAHQAEVAEVFMRDASIEVVQVRLNPRHPIADVCDLHARADLYGLGPGCYPKARAPRPPFHPHCLTGDALISHSGKILAVTRRWFDGYVFVVTTASGKRLTATANHPILTRGGWVGAGLLNVGDDVFTRRVGVPVSGNTIGDDHHQDMPSSIAEIADAFFRSREVSAIEVPVAAEHFHGDGVGSDVAVVGANRQLWDRVDTGGAKIGHDSHFGGSDMRQSPLLGDSSLHFGGERFRDATNGVVSGSSHGRTLGGGHAAETDDVLLALASQRDIGRHEPPGDGIAGDAELARQIQHGSTGPVFADKVTNIKRLAFSGHVFNLETDQGHYTGNGIVTHNCWCRLTSRPDLAEDEARSVDDPSAQARAYLRSLPSAEAARVLGSRERLQRALQGDDPIRLIDAGKPTQYRTQRLGDVRPSPLPESP